MAVPCYSLTLMWAAALRAESELRPLSHFGARGFLAPWDSFTSRFPESQQRFPWLSLPQSFAWFWKRLIPLCCFPHGTLTDRDTFDDLLILCCPESELFSFLSQNVNLWWLKMCSKFIKKAYVLVFPSHFMHFSWTLPHPLKKINKTNESTIILKFFHLL